MTGAVDGPGKVVFDALLVLKWSWSRRLDTLVSAFSSVEVVTY
jgi:hypothetical protein